MKTRHNLAGLRWTLTGWTPHLWRLVRSHEQAQVRVEAAPVPGSVQEALRAAGELPDWTVGLESRACEWVENRHWSYQAQLPDEWIEQGHTTHLSCLGLDYSGWVYLNGREVAAFSGALCPHSCDLTPYLRERDNSLQIVFDCPPRWLGQIGYTSQMTQWKPRFNYTWDWIPRLVQTGIWDDLLLVVDDGHSFGQLDLRTGADEAGGRGTLHVAGPLPEGLPARVRLSLYRDGDSVRVEEVAVQHFVEGVEWGDLEVALWWPNGAGEQPLYILRCELLDGQGAVLDVDERRTGFKSVTWQPCEGAPVTADPWLCVVNGRPLFLQGVNWTPIRPNFADVTEQQYRQRLTLYRDLGCNILRVWGGAFLEKELFYNLCDELGLLVWQEFPLSSSAVENRPPEDERAIAELAAIATSYIERRRHHVSLAVWCGGNELQEVFEEGRQDSERPVDLSHPLIARLAQVVMEHDPARRFLPTSPSGPRFSALQEEFGQGVHWDVHGPWQPEGDLETAWMRYWQGDDALFRSETGTPSASPAALIRAFKGDCDEVPGSLENPLWNRTAWWTEWPRFVQEHGREPRDLEEYVAWSQERQARALEIAARACKQRFPRCGGFIVWMGHDCFPCTANTAIVDFEGRPKPAARRLARVFHEPSS